MLKRHVVIADDEKLLCVTIADFLRDEGYRVTIVHDGCEVLPVLEKEKADLVLLDLMMPTMNGMETLALIKKHSPETRVIMLTGYGTMNYVLQSQQMGSDGFVNKPFGVETLMRRIRTVLSGSSRQPFHEPALE
jgi:DNA-binding response OmpR family regulator